MMYVSQKQIKRKTVIILDSHGPPNSARPQLKLFLRIMSKIMVAIASPVNTVTLKPRLPPSTSNGSFFNIT